ncbi:MAG: hypothetical protein EOM12_02640 [Verrucomicrobiae bacterium]|nr:hypothetical protein [Verrucomicrobiae bacterium]
MNALGVGSNVIYRWRKLYTPAGEKTKSANNQDEILQLRSHSAEFEEKNDIFKTLGLFRQTLPMKATERCRFLE